MKKLRISVEGKTYDVTVEVLEDTDEWAPPLGGLSVDTTSTSAAFELTPDPSPDQVSAAPPLKKGDVVSPMSATVVAVLVKSGESVTAGQALVVLEAMKMESTVSAPASGTVKSVHVEAGAAVGEGQALVSFA